MIGLLRQLLAAILAFTITIPACAFTYDAVGNRTQLSSTLAPVPAGLFNYDANDRFTAGDTYDNNGNTVSSGGIGNVYDFENRLIQKGGVTIVYDGDGNRVKKTVAGVTTTYLVDDLNPTGYAQVITETYSGGTGNHELSRAYVYGLERISQRRSFVVSGNTQTQNSFYVYDGHGSVRALTSSTGAVTDTYDYDAFGNLIHSTGSTPNNYLFAAEQWVHRSPSGTVIQTDPNGSITVPPGDNIVVHFFKNINTGQQSNLSSNHSSNWSYQKHEGCLHHKAGRNSSRRLPGPSHSTHPRV